MRKNMKNRMKLLMLGCIVTLAFGCKKDDSGDVVIVEVKDTMHYVYTMETSKGDIELYLYKDVPAHFKNFDSLSRAGFYDGLIFHRVIKNFMIQGGDPKGNGTGGPGYTVKAEIMSKYKHKHGALAAARQGNSVNPEKRSSGSQFYIVEDQNGEPGLDGEYTVFGETLKGLDVITAIASVAKDVNDKPETDVVIEKITVQSFTELEMNTVYNFQIP